MCSKPLILHEWSEFLSFTKFIQMHWFIQEPNMCYFFMIHHWIIFFHPIHSKMSLYEWVTESILLPNWLKTQIHPTAATVCYLSIYLFFYFCTGAKKSFFFYFKIPCLIHCYLLFLCNYLWNVPLISEWKLLQSKFCTIFSVFHWLFQMPVVCQVCSCTLQLCVSVHVHMHVYAESVYDDKTCWKRPSKWPVRSLIKEKDTVTLV